MKRLLSITLIAVICILMCACSMATTPPEIEEETTTHTLPPTQNELAEPEWAEVDCDIALVDADGEIVLSSDYFKTFAVVNDSKITIKVSDEGTDIIHLLGSDGKLSLSINKETVECEAITPSTFTGEINIIEEENPQNLYDLANIIRGLV